MGLLKEFFELQDMSPSPKKYTLPVLPYAYDALVPYIDEETMQLHHTKHQQAYVDGLNEAYDNIRHAQVSGDYSMLQHHMRKAAFNGGGVWNHTLFWESMCPAHESDLAGLTPELEVHIEKCFGSLANMVETFTQAAISVEGSGWAMLCYDPGVDMLLVQTVENQQNNHRPGVVPILALDVWEHAYYLSYRNRRKEYIQNWWNIVDWRALSDRFAEIPKVVQVPRS